MKRVRTSLFLAAMLGFLAHSRIALADVIGLEVIGPNEVAENFSASYKAIAHYDDDSTRDVTDSALWAVEPSTSANIGENGVLTTKDIVTHQSVTILASYTEGNVTVEAEKAIDILAICPTGTALQFDGVDDYVEIPDAPSLRFTQHDSFTISYWALPISDMLGGWVLCKMQPSVQSHCFTYETKWDSSNSTFSFVISRANSTGWVLLQTIVGSAPAGGWFHVATVYDNRDMKIYLNGQLSNSGYFPYTTDIIPSDCNISIGARLIISTLEEGRFFDGTIDEVAIYNRSLSDEEIQANMHTRLAGDEPNLVAYWDFDEGEGQIVYDLSGNGNDGYLGGDPYAVEESDPLWVESDAPVGICSFYEIATLATDGAVGRKTALVEELLSGLAQEWAAYEELEEWLESGDYGGLNYGDIVTARQKIHSAIQHEGQQSISALEKSVEKLKDALSSLGYEPEPATLNQETLALSDLEWREPVPVTEVNTDFAEEWTPFLSFDGLTLYFAIVRSTTFYYGRIFEATRGQPYGPFTLVKEIDGTLNSSPGHVVSPWVSPDNLRMYYYTESSGRWELKVTERASDNAPWPIGTNISELNVLNRLHQTPRLTADELTIFFSSYNMPGGYGGYDIWMATRPDRYSPFGQVTNLAEINTASFDHAPFVSADGLTLYFDSNRNGQFQLFQATRESLNEPFGNIEHLSLFDTPEGTSAHPCVSSDGTAIYFIRDIEGEHSIWVSYRLEPYEIAIIRTEDAIARKVEVLEEINAELEKEWAAYAALEEWLESGDYGDLNYGDIVTAKQKIHSAIQHEEQSIDALEKSIGKLKDALSALGYDPAGQATNPNPANGTMNVSTNADLTWTAGSKAVSHDVYFGTTSPPPFIGNQTDTIFYPGTMTGVTKYYWRIDEVNPSWTTTGTVWTFTTILSPPPLPP